MKTIFEKEIILTEKDSKTNIEIPFSLPYELNKMQIDFTYSPKELDDKNKALEMIKKGMQLYAPGEYAEGYDEIDSYLPVVNLVTISLDAPDGYRGAGHRHNNRQSHILTATKCSHGFITGKLLKGDWRVVINAHAVVTEKCICNLKILGE